MLPPVSMRASDMHGSGHTCEVLSTLVHTSVAGWGLLCQRDQLVVESLVTKCSMAGVQLGVERKCSPCAMCWRLGYALWGGGRLLRWILSPVALLLLALEFASLGCIGKFGAWCRHCATGVSGVCALKRERSKVFQGAVSVLHAQQLLLVVTLQGLYVT
jgi:hypothetical protein